MTGSHLATAPVNFESESPTQTLPRKRDGFPDSVLSSRNRVAFGNSVLACRRGGRTHQEEFGNPSSPARELDRPTLSSPAPSERQRAVLSSSPAIAVELQPLSSPPAREERAVPHSSGPRRKPGPHSLSDGLRELPRCPRCLMSREAARGQMRARIRREPRGRNPGALVVGSLLPQRKPRVERTP